MARKTFPIQMVFESVDRFSTGFRKITNSMQKFEKSANRVSSRISMMGRESGITRIANSSARLGRSLGTAGREASILAAKLSAAGIAAGWLFKREFIDTAAQFERYGVMLETIEGNAQKAREALDYITEFTARTPYEIQNVTDAYVKLRNFGLDPADGSLQAIADTTSMLGGEAETMNGIILALGQAWTKQKLQGEEALQMLERGVPVWDLLSKATGKTTAELQKLSSAGQLGREAIEILIRAMGERAVGASDKFSKTFTGMTSNLIDRWTQFKVAVMDSGPFDLLRQRLSDLLARISAMAANGELQALAERVGASIVKTMNHMIKFGRELWDVMQTVGRALTWIHDLFGSWKPLIYGIVAILAGPLITALVGVAGALGSVAAAFALTPFGAVTVAVGALSAGIVALVKNWDALWQAAKRLAGGIGFGKEKERERANLANPRIVDLVTRQAELNNASGLGPRATTENKVLIEIPSLPPGARATMAGDRNTPISLDVGYSMGAL